MVLVREAVLLLATGLVGWLAPRVVGGLATGGASFLAGVFFALPFQVLYALAGLAARRAPAWLAGSLGLLAWVGSFWPVFGRGLVIALRAGLPGPEGTFIGYVLGQAAAPLALAMLAMAVTARRRPPGSLAGGSRARAGAGRAAAGPAVAALWAIYLWAVPFFLARQVIFGLLPPGIGDLPRLILNGVGAAYLSLRVGAAVLWPLSVDLPFQSNRYRLSP